MGNLYAVAIWGSVLLGAIVLVLSAYALVTRRLSDSRQTRAARLRPRMTAAVEAYLAGQALVDEAHRELDADPDLAAGVLLGIASVHGRADQLRLHPLARRLLIEPRAMQELGRRNPALRARAAVKLGYLGSDNAVPALLEALQDDQLDVRLAAAQALVQMRHVPAIGPVLRALAMPGRWPLQRATELLVDYGDDVVEPLRGVLAARDEVPPPAAVSVALNVLGMLGARRAAPEVLGWLEHNDPEIRVAAARALGGMAERGTSPALVRALRDEEWEVRSMAAKALGQLREAGVIQALEGALSDPAWWVRFNAAQSLAELGANGMEALRRAMNTDEDAFARDISRQLLEERNPRVQEATP